MVGRLQCGNSTETMYSGNGKLFARALDNLVCPDSGHIFIVFI